MQQTSTCFSPTTSARHSCALRWGNSGKLSPFILGILLAVSNRLAPAQIPPKPPPPPAADVQIAEHPVVHARLATGPIDIDGKLNEPDWQNAEPMVLTQQSPHPGESTPYVTTVRVLIYHDALIFGFDCHDPNPKAIQVHTLAQDGDQTGDDTVSVLLDTFGDKRTGYYFQINEAAGREDGLISGPSNYSLDWDGIWNARTARTADGWSAEIWIPAQTLNFAGASGHWGLQVERSIVRSQTDLRWSSPTLDSDLWDMSRAGDLEIMTPLKQGHGIEFAPYTSGTMLRDFAPTDRNWTGTGGGEITWRITPQLAAVLSVNTDFAETEVDSRQINITPWPLYFPEKRAFFLEGANQYIFGLDLNTPTSQTFIPFFSRNVGLLDGYDIPLLGGIKLNGHVGPWSLAFLDAQTQTTYVPDTVVQYLGLPSAKVDGTNLLASRVSYDVDKHLRVGAIVTHGDPEALVSNTLAGADADWNTSTFMGKHSLAFGGWAATTQGDLPEGNREAWGLRFDYPNDLLNCTAGTNQYGDGFNPLLGFLPRPATHQTDASCAFGPRPKADGPFGAIRQTKFKLFFNRITDTQGNVQSQLFTVDPFLLYMNSGDILYSAVYIDHEVLQTPFTIVPNRTYPAGSYDFQRYALAYISSPHRQWQFFSGSTVGGYYNGHLYHQDNTLNWTSLRGKVQLGVAADNYFANTPQGKFVEKLWQFTGALSWNPNLSLSTFVQYDNVSFDLSSNTRLRWTFRPGDDFYVVWDRTWVRNTRQPGSSFDPDAESVVAKIRWTFRP